MLLFYLTTIGLYLLNRGYMKQLIYKITVKENKSRIYLHNENKTKQNTLYFETDIDKLISIKSSAKNTHKIFYLDAENRILQLFALKNGFYDKAFLYNLCSPKVKSVIFTNVNF